MITHANMRARINRVRADEDTKSINASSIQEIQLNPEQIKTIKVESFLLIDTGKGDRYRMLAFATRFFINCIL